MRFRVLATAGVLAATALAATIGLGVGPAASFNPTPEPPRVVPVDGAHWQAGQGWTDATGNSALGLVQTPPPVGDSHQRVAYIQHLPGSVTQLGFASRTPSGIDPCWLVGITGPDGETTTLHLTVDSARVVGDTPPPVGDFAPYIQRVWTLNLPSGAVVTSALAELMTNGQQPPPVNDKSAFDRFTVNGVVIGTP